jgi:hypothetical protein
MSFGNMCSKKMFFAERCGTWWKVSALLTLTISRNEGYLVWIRSSMKRFVSFEVLASTAGDITIGKRTFILLGL